jgi:hypothetical protein
MKFKIKQYFPHLFTKKTGVLKNINYEATYSFHFSTVQNAALFWLASLNFHG